MKNTIQSFRLAALQVVFFERKYKTDYKRFLIMESVKNGANSMDLIVSATELKLDDIRVFCSSLVRNGFLEKKKQGIYVYFSCTQKALDFLSQIEKDNNH
jgi:predicted transcriptional regulator